MAFLNSGQARAAGTRLPVPKSRLGEVKQAILKAMPALAVGVFVKPTVFVNVKNDTTIAQEEIFGPVLDTGSRPFSRRRPSSSNDDDAATRSAILRHISRMLGFHAPYEHMKRSDS
jgi:aldehyde dehydrogenase (NAD+)